MKARLSLCIPVVAGMVVCSLGGTALGQDAVAVAGDFYEVVIDNPQIRVLRATYPPGARSVMHDHPPSVVIQITGGSLRFSNGVGQTLEQILPAGRVVLSGGRHAVENIGTEPIVVVIVELMALPGQVPGQ